MNSVHPEDRDRVLAAFEEVTRGRGVTIEHRVVRPDGAVRRVWGQGTPIPDPDGVVRRVIGQVTDVTEQKEAEEALARSQRQFRRLLDSNIIGISLANGWMPVEAVAALFLSSANSSQFTLSV